MDSVYIYAAAGPAPVKVVKRRESRIRSSFFGSGRRGSCDLAPEEAETSGMKSPSRSMTSSTSDDKENSSFLNRRKLRKSTSHASLASISTAYEAQRQEKLGRRGFTDLLRGGGKQTPPVRPSIGSRKLTHPISKPFNFSHVTHTNSTTFSQIQQTEDSVLVQDWHKAVRESRMPGSRRKTESTVVVTPATVALQRTTSIRSRKRANTNLTISPRDSIDLGQPSPTLSDENTIHTCPRTPPPRTTSKHCLRSLVEDPVEEDNECVFRPGRDSVFLLGGRKTPIKVVREQMSDSDSSNSSTNDEYDEGISELRSSKSTPDLLALRRNSYLMGRPVSQIGVFDDSTATSAQTNRMSMAGRRMSKRFSIRPDALAQDVGDFLDSWEEGIDWCYENDYENEVDEIQWDTPDYGMTPTPSCESLPIDNDMLKVPEVKDEFVLVEKRITGVFEDKLLLPPSPQLTSFPDSTIGIADGGFESYEAESEDIIFRAASTALRHRSISSAASLPDLIHSRPYRDELNRVAQQLDDHIAALNQESTRPISTNTRDPHAFYLGNRSRAYSEATCVTLCSDSTETATPASADEIPTPNSSAHNSFQFTGRDDGRAEKGLSFPAAALPGVIEFAPDGLHHIAADEQEFVHFI